MWCSCPDAHGERVLGVEEERGLGVDVGRAADARMDPAVNDPRRSLEDAADDALLPPDLARGERAVGHQAGDLRAGAGAAGGAVVRLARAEDEVLAVRPRIARRAVQLDVVDLAAVVAA